MANSIKVGDKIKRISNGATGEVIETNEAELATLSDLGKSRWKPRARIKWTSFTGPRTWIAFTDLMVIE